MSSKVSALPQARRTTPGPPQTQGTLALDLTSAPPPRPPTQPRAGAGADAVWVATALRDEVHRWSATFVQACVEAILGDRPVSQLVRWTTPAIHEELAQRALAVAQAAGTVPGLRRRSAPRPQVASVRSCFLAPDRVEIAVVVRHATRSRCVAARLEKITGRWQCTQIRFG